VQTQVIIDMSDALPKRCGKMSADADSIYIDMSDALPGWRRKKSAQVPGRSASDDGIMNLQLILGAAWPLPWKTTGLLVYHILFARKAELTL
jgi:hypothetical protein